MKLFPLTLAFAKANPSPNSSTDSLPAEIFVCDANELGFGGDVNGKYRKQHNGPDGVDYYQSDSGVVIYWQDSVKTWTMNRSLGANFGWYHHAGKDLLENSAWFVTPTGGSIPIPHIINGQDVWTESLMRVGTVPGCYCAVIYDADQEDPTKFLVVQEGNNSNMRKVGGIKWSNKASFVNVQDGCELSGYNKPNFDQLMGVWDGSHVLSGRREDNKLTSYQCSCTINVDCGNDFYNGGATPDTCQNPQCDVAQHNIVDSWNSEVRMRYIPVRSDINQSYFRWVA